MNAILEYIWIGGNNEIRSKTRVIPNHNGVINEWNYDGSSTWQADCNGDTEIILKPCSIFKNPLRNIEDTDCYIVLCETYDSNGEPAKNNYRYESDIIFNKSTEEKPWFGLEQEYFIFFYNDNNVSTNIEEGYHYCGITENHTERIIAEKHMELCIKAGLQISGINAEVSKSQWEFQIGPCEGINAGDHLIVARYLLERISEIYGARVSYHPKPFIGINGSGCHINFSTTKTREENGIEIINEYIKKLSEKHLEHIQAYGENNHLRLTGLNETSSIHKFTYGIGTRNTSIRIPNQVYKEKSGYFEDRRPASNIDPYLTTSLIFKTCCL